MPKRPTRTRQKKISSKGADTAERGNKNAPTLCFAGDKLPISHAAVKDEHLTEGYLHSLIDQLHQLVSQLKTERAFLETALKQMPCGVMIADAPSGRLRTPNAMVDEIL